MIAPLLTGLGRGNRQDLVADGGRRDRRRPSAVLAYLRACRSGRGLVQDPGAQHLEAARSGLELLQRRSWKAPGREASHAAQRCGPAWASNDAEVPAVGPLDFVDVPHRQAFTDGGYVVASAEDLWTEVVDEHLAALSVDDLADVTPPTKRVGDLLFN